jgi:GGDEF domain-containing protein
VSVQAIVEMHHQLPHRGIAFVEVDRFKSVNDRFGYENADLFFKGLAWCCSARAVGSK